MLVLLAEILQKPTIAPSGYEVLSNDLVTKEMDGSIFQVFKRYRVICGKGMPEGVFKKRSEEQKTR